MYFGELKLIPTLSQSISLHRVFFFLSAHASVLVWHISPQKTILCLLWFMCVRVGSEISAVCGPMSTRNAGPPCRKLCVGLQAWLHFIAVQKFFLWGALLMLADWCNLRSCAFGAKNVFPLLNQRWCSGEEMALAQCTRGASFEAAQLQWWVCVCVCVCICVRACVCVCVSWKHCSPLSSITLLILIFL